MANLFGEVGTKLGEKVFSGILWFGIAFIVISIIVGVMWYFLVYKRKFNIFVKIISERSSDKDSILFDYAAILKDKKTDSKYFKLWSLKGIELPVPPFNILQRTDKGDYLELRRTAEDKFYFLSPPKINKKYIIKSNGKVYPISTQKTIRNDFDMDYWAAKRKTQNKGMFDPDKLWSKILLWMPQIIGGVFLIFVLYILMSYLPGILAELKNLVQELNARNIAEVKAAVSLLLLRWK